MQPQQPIEQNRAADGFKPKWRHFHPMSRIWVRNPFDHDIVFRVADEYNRPFEYLMPAHKISELPGGSIATLGVKAVVDELIQNSPEDVMRQWDENVRSRHEKDVIVRIKETSPTADAGPGGRVDLSVKNNDDVEPDEPVAVAAPEEAFPALQQPVREPVAPQLQPEVQQGLDDLVGASLDALPGEAKVGANNAHADAEE